MENDDNEVTKATKPAKQTPAEDAVEKSNDEGKGGSSGKSKSEEDAAKVDPAAKEDRPGGPPTGATRL